MPDLDVVLVGEPDKYSRIGIKRLGEIGLVGVSAAIANAVYHATARRIKSLGSHHRPAPLTALSRDRVLALRPAPAARGTS